MSSVYERKRQKIMHYIDGKLLFATQTDVSDVCDAADTLQLVGRRCIVKSALSATPALDEKCLLIEILKRIDM